MFKIKFVLLISIFYTASLFSQNTGKEIVEKCIQYCGGMNKLTGWKSLTFEGELTRDFGPDWGRLRGKVNRYIIKPDKYREDQDFSYFDRHPISITAILNGDEGWVITNLVPAYNPRYAAVFKRTLSIMEGIAIYYKNASSLTLKQDDIVDKKPVYTIEAIINTDTSYLYIDKKDFLLIKSTIRTQTMLFTDYKKYNGILFPTKVRTIVKTPEGDREVYFYDIKKFEIDVPIDQTLFEEEKPKKEKAK